MSASAFADTKTAKAKQLYDDGLTAYNLGRYEQALGSFESGYMVKHDPAFLFNIGQCQRQLRRYQDAERSYRAYLRESADLPLETREQVQKLVAEMQKAIDDQRAKLPPPGTAPPTEPQPRTAAEQPAAPSPTIEVQAPVPTLAVTAPAPRRRPAYKKAWVWGVVGGAVVLVAAGVTVGVILGTRDSTRTLADFTPAP
jgi:hypothetical protein